MWQTMNDTSSQLGDGNGYHAHNGIQRFGSCPIVTAARAANGDGQGRATSLSAEKQPLLGEHLACARCCMHI